MLKLRRMIILWMLAVVFTGLTAVSASVIAAETVQQVQMPAIETPSYVRWGSLAMQELRKSFPQAEIADFLYVACKPLNETTSQQIFKYWVRQAGKEFAVYVTLTYNSRTEELLSAASERSVGKLAAYEKWRDLAVQSIPNRYPHAKVLDLRPAGCKFVHPDSAVQTFRFWLVDGGKWILVDTTITYRTSDDHLLSINFTEKKRWDAGPVRE